MKPAADDRTPPTRRDGLAALALAAVTAATFWPALGCEFVNFDDNYYVTLNRHVTDGLGLAQAGWAFTTFDAANWHPLTWLTLQLDASLWKGPDGKPDPRGFHLTNVLLHAANAALLFLALRALTGAFWRSAAVALLFAVHPLRAESVAWVAERKDVLCASFGLLALWAYAGYARAPCARRFVLVAVPFGLSLLAKPMLVTLPCLLLVLDGWPLGRAKAAGDWLRLVVEKLPLFALAAASSVVTARAQSGAVADLERFPPEVRLANAAVSYVAYLADTFWPAGLSVYYPHPYYSPEAREQLYTAAAGATALLAAVTAAAAALRRRAPYVPAGWLWYAGLLVPVIGVVQVGGQGRADRYTYLPQIGLLLAVCWGAADLARAWPQAARAAAGVTAVVLAALTWNQVQVWHDSVTLWEHALRVTRRNPMCLMNLASALEERNLLPQAADFYRETLRMDRDFKLARLRLTDLLLRQGRAEMKRGNRGGAAACYGEVVRLRPEVAEAHSGLGAILIELGREEEGLAELREAVRCDPDSGPAHAVLAEKLESRGDLDGAAKHYGEATRVDPDWAAAWYGLGTVRARQSRLAEAAEALARAVEREPGSAEYRAALSSALDSLTGAGHGDLARAIRQRLKRTDPGGNGGAPGPPAGDR